MKKFFREFQEFAMKGNVMDMAVGIIIGGAFGKIVSSFVADVIMPPVGMLLGKTNFSDLAITLHRAADGTAAVTLNYGNFVQTVVDFLIIAMSVFLLIRLLNSARRRAEELEKRGRALMGKSKKDATSGSDAAVDDVPAPPATVSDPRQEELLAEIRDLLKKMAGSQDKE